MAETASAVSSTRSHLAPTLDLLRGLIVIVVIFLGGTLLHRWHIPIAGGVLGLLLFYVALLTGIVRLRWVERAAGLLLSHMVLLFVPLTVGLMDIGPILSRQAVAILVSLVVSFLAVLLTTGLLARWMLHPVSAAPRPPECSQ
jgi:holin-like protein